MTSALTQEQKDKTLEFVVLDDPQTDELTKQYDAMRQRLDKLSSAQRRFYNELHSFPFGDHLIRNEDSSITIVTIGDGVDVRKVVGWIDEPDAEGDVVEPGNEVAP